MEGRVGSSFVCTQRRISGRGSLTSFALRAFPGGVSLWWGWGKGMVPGIRNVAAAMVDPEAILV